MILDETSIEFDVPEHAGINQTQYLYDYDVVSIYIELKLLISNVLNSGKFLMETFVLNERTLRGSHSLQSFNLTLSMEL